MGLRDLLRMPEAQQLQDLDDPAATEVHARIIRRKGFLQRFYRTHYRRFKKRLPQSPGGAPLWVELGSGGGFIKELIPGTVTSDILELPDVDRQLSGLDMSFEDASVDAFLMINVFHHVPDAGHFLREMARCLRPGGRIIMLEPASTLFGRIIWKRFHHEPFDPSGNWCFESAGPLSSANGALPWIVFDRDRARFKTEFPSLRVVERSFHPSLTYLLSGGFTLRQLLPGFMYVCVRGVDCILTPLGRILGLFQTIVLEKERTG